MFFFFLLADDPVNAGVIAGVVIAVLFVVITSVVGLFVLGVIATKRHKKYRLSTTFNTVEENNLDENYKPDRNSYIEEHELKEQDGNDANI